MRRHILQLSFFLVNSATSSLPVGHSASSLLVQVTLPVTAVFMMIVMATAVWCKCQRCLKTTLLLSNMVCGNLFFYFSLTFVSQFCLQFPHLLAHNLFWHCYQFLLLLAMKMSTCFLSEHQLGCGALMIGNKHILQFVGQYRRKSRAKHPQFKLC